MKPLKCTCGIPIFFDDIIFYSIKEIQFYCNIKGIVYTKINGVYHNAASFVLPKKEGFIIDHKSRDGHDNQTNNLRYATNQQNNCNQGIRKDNKTGYKGVTWNLKLSKYVASICFNKKSKHIGCFITPEEAALAYNNKAKELFAEFAYLNNLM